MFVYAVLQDDVYSDWHVLGIFSDRLARERAIKGLVNAECIDPDEASWLK